MSAVVESHRNDLDVSYAVDFSRDREPVKQRSRFPEYRRTGSAPARVNGMHCRRSKRWTWGSGRGARMQNARAFAGCLAVALASVSASVLGVTIDYAPVNNAGNPANPATGLGADRRSLTRSPSTRAHRVGRNIRSAGATPPKE